MAITDAKTQIGLPVGATGVKESDGTAATVKYVPVGENMIANSGAESDTTGWTLANGATLTRDTGTYKIGSASLKVARGSADNGATLTTRLSVTPGVVYQLGAWVHAATSSGASLNVRWYDSAAASISTSATSPSSSTLNGWAWLAGVVTAPPAAVTVDVELNVATSNHCFFDAVTLRPCVPVVETPYTEPAVGLYASGAVTYSVSGDAAFLGDVKLFDMDAQTDGTLADSSYTRVYDARHVFVGDLLIDNGVLRVWLKRGHSTSGAFRVSVYSNAAWQTFATARIDTGGTSSATFRTFTLKTLRRGEVGIEATDTDGNVALFTVRRGWHALKVKTTRVFDVGGTQVVSMINATRILAYNASTVLNDTTPNPAQTSVAGTSLTEPYAYGFTPTHSYWRALGFAGKPTTLYFESDQTVAWSLTTASVAALEKTFWIVLAPWPWLLTGYYLVEAESQTLAGGAASAVDATASSGNVAALDANGETVDYSATATRDLPLGHYTMVIRAKDTAQVASDCTMSVYNTTDASSLASGAKTLTASYAFYTLDFELATASDADAIRFRAAKSTATANTISVDTMMLIPRKRNSVTPSHVWFPYDVARNALMDTTTRESVREA